ncbi:MAG: cysteine--tRNA ligase, partial [Bacteroidales bacterium]|nr:cysteine--tRNA ligase [Bacteroidales bacterium]
MSSDIKREFYLYNTLSRRKERLETITPGRVGLYVCGPTVYGDPHLGHARPGVTFDVLVRLLRNIGYKVRYVRNITDVGHLEHDADEGEDKIAKKARLEQLEPMEVAQTYTVHFRQAMAKLNVLPPSIEPNASGHIIEQIEFIKKILDNGYAYISNGSVYFDVQKYAQNHNYGALSGRNLDEMLHNTRELDGQQDKHSSADFALWKKARPEHIMRWPSPWGDGFPGWHMECSAMGEKYLGKEFDIHGGGMDLMFPHHECEMAQNFAERGSGGVKYWMHNNLITIEGRKMGKSLGNFITLDELFNGTNPNLEQAYTPMTVRFFILQAHYRGTLDFSNSALQAAEKGLKRLMQAIKDALSLKTSEGAEVQSSVNDSKVPASGIAEEISKIREDIFTALCDDMNTPVALSYIYELVKIVNNAKEGRIVLTKAEKDAVTALFKEVVTDILGLIDEDSAQSADGRSNSSKVIDGLMNYIIEDRKT